MRSNVFLNFFLSFWYDERTIFAFSRFFLTGLSKLLSTCPQVQVEPKLCSFEGKAFFHLFRTLSKKFLACWQNLFGGFIKTAFYVSIGTLWGEKLLFWKIRIFITLGPWANNFRFLVAKISSRLWKLHSKGPENHFQENLLFLKKKVLSVSELERKVFGLLARFYQQICQNCIIRDHKKIRENFFWKYFIIAVRFCAKNILFFLKKKLNGFVKLHSTCPEEFFETIFYCLLSVTFSKFELRIFCLLAKTYEQWFQNCVLRSHRIILMGFFGKKPLFCSFADLDQKLFSLLAKLFNKVVGTALYVSIGRLWGEKLLFWKIGIFITLGHWAKNFRFLVAKISSRLWKLHSKGPENHFQENLLFLKKNCCQFRTLSETFLVFSWNFISKFVKTALYETTKKLERTFFEKFS